MYPYFKTESFPALFTFGVFLRVFSFTKPQPEAATTTSTVFVEYLKVLVYLATHTQ